MLKKIISGWQNGADRAALDAAKRMGIATGGTCPKGGRVVLLDGSDGVDTSFGEYGLVEHSSREYPPRTIANVANSDGTLWIGDVNSRGGKLTIKTCVNLRRPYLVNPSVEGLQNWVEENRIETLNVAGNRASGNPGVVPLTTITLLSAFGKVIPKRNLSLPDDGYLCHRPWWKETFCQCGESGVVLGRPGTTAFFEAFPKNIDTFIRGEGTTLEEAEEKAWQQFVKIYHCPGHEFEARGYRNGCGICKHCGMLGSDVLPLTEKCQNCGKLSYWSLDKHDQVWCEDCEHLCPEEDLSESQIMSREIEGMKGEDAEIH